VTLVTGNFAVVGENAPMKSLGMISLLLTALIVPGGFLLLAPLAVRAYRNRQR
jgi:hypothetical protein